MTNHAGMFKPSHAPVLWAACVCVAAFVAAAACGGGGGNGDDARTGAPSDRTPTPCEESTTFSLCSDAFAPDEAIPARFTCDGDDVSPGLSWGNLPERTSFSALIMEDLDAPGEGFTHWVIYNIPSAGLPEGVIEGLVDLTGSLQGMNDFGRLAYGGPCPPAGSRHRYRFTVYALNGLIYPPDAPSKQAVLGAMQGHILGQAELVGTYER